jgi:hypothetical protein
VPVRLDSPVLGKRGFGWLAMGWVTLDQRPLRSMLIREYVRYKPGDGIRLVTTKGGVVTGQGRDAYHDFHSRNIIRSN